MENDNMALAAGSRMLLKRQQMDLDNPPMPHGGFGQNGGWYIPRPWMIAMASILGGLVLAVIIYAVYTAISRKKKGTSTADIKKGISHQRSMSGISEDDPDNIKPVKRLRSFHMKGAGVVSPDSMSPRTPKTPKDGGLFGRFFRKKDGKRLAPLDEEQNESYESLNRYPDTPGIDEKMLEASPPPTPAPAFGWSSGAPLNKRASTGDGVGEQSTAYKGDTRPPMGQGESDSFLSGDNRKSKDQKRMSTGWDENYQSKPVGGYFDDDEDDRRPLAYDPDSRSGH